MTAHSKPSRLLVATSSGACAVAVLAVLAPALAHAHSQGPATIVVVTMTNAALRLAPQRVPGGTVVFKVANNASSPRTFRIAGKSTPSIAPGKTATLKVELTKVGPYRCVSVAQGRATGLKGVFSVVRTPRPPSTTPAGTASASASSSSSSSSARSKTCASPASTTVSVEAFSYGFNLSQDSVPCGTITFKLTNTDPPGRTTSGAHDFVIEEVLNYPELQASSATINPGESTTMTVILTPGKYTYICNVSEHDELGQIGSLTVTG